MAEKQPKRRRSEEHKLKKKGYDQARGRSRVNIGEAFQRWRDLRDLKGLKTDAEVALLLLDRGYVAVLAVHFKRHSEAKYLHLVDVIRKHMMASE
ncbi:hypothetical protein N1851_027300 [Merluccius polli]|uniref:Uncharacterized protein n=1 Tax=Merluccius polli TaxID=89951 RepID=A0AA47NTA6_MERPO|nr:hypothetical protein N1851_027300 [Merluccius polli]